MNVPRSLCNVPDIFSILTKSGFCRQIFVKDRNIKFHENSSSESGVHTYGQTDMEKIKNRHDVAKKALFAIYAKAPNIDV
jgi:hypothetical protein